MHTGAQISTQGPTLNGQSQSLKQSERKVGENRFIQASRGVFLPYIIFAAFCSKVVLVLYCFDDTINQRVINLALTLFHQS